MASIRSGIIFSYLTALYPFSLVVTTSGSTASISWAITPISWPEKPCIFFLSFFQSNVYPPICSIFSIAFFIGLIFFLRFSSEVANATTSFAASILPITADPVVPTPNEPVIVVEPEITTFWFKWVTKDAVWANDELNAWVANEAVPNNELVMLLILKLPVDTIDPLVKIEPVNVKVSALAENNVVPVDPTKLVEPLTVREPDITTAWLSWLTLEAVDANDALTAFNT